MNLASLRFCSDLSRHLKKKKSIFRARNSKLELGVSRTTSANQPVIAMTCCEAEKSSMITDPNTEYGTRIIASHINRL